MSGAKPSAERPRDCAPRAPVIARDRPLLALLAPVRGPLLAAAVLHAVAAVASIVPFVCVVEIARRLLAPPADEAQIRALVVVAVCAFGLRLLAQGASGQITHLADNTFQLAVRRRVAAHLGRLPLGWFGARNSGEVKRAVQDDVAAMHYMVAHSLPDLVAGVVAPLTALAYLVTIDWRLTLITLAPVLVFAVLYSTIVRGYSSQMAGHAAALGRVNGAVVELVQGIAVVKAFGAAGRPHARYARATAEFADFHDAWVRPIARRSALAELACSPPVMLLTVLVRRRRARGVGLARADRRRAVRPARARPDRAAADARLQRAGLPPRRRGRAARHGAARAQPPAPARGRRRAGAGRRARRADRRRVLLRRRAARCWPGSAPSWSPAP